MVKPRKLSAEFKAKIALAALRKETTTAEFRRKNQLVATSEYSPDHRNWPNRLENKQITGLNAADWEVLEEVYMRKRQSCRVRQALTAVSLRALWRC